MKVSAGFKFLATMCEGRLAYWQKYFDGMQTYRVRLQGSASTRCSTDSNRCRHTDGSDTS
jgi:hypothetical protein